MHQKIEPKLIREWVYQAVKQQGSSGIPELDRVLLFVYGEACSEHLLQPKMMGPNVPASPSLADIPADLQNEVRAVIWDLIIQGIIVPGVPNQSGSNGLPSFVVTEWGRKCLEQKEYLTFDAARYIARIQSSVPGLDSTALLYLKDSLASFRVGAYLSSAVMTGVASERVLLLLRDAVERALSTPDRKKKFSDATKGISINRVFQETWKRLEPNQDSLAQHLGQEDVKVELAGIFDLIRKTRNDGGHPTGRHVSRDEADSLLHLFPVYCKTAYATIAWLHATPLP